MTVDTGGRNMSRRRSGIRIISDEPGCGPEAKRGDAVSIRCSITLSRGDLVFPEQSQTFTIGQRNMIAGLEYGVEGMRVGGRRRFRVSPHLAYRDVGVDGKIPPNAVLDFDVRLISVENRRST